MTQLFIRDLEDSGREDEVGFIRPRKVEDDGETHITPLIDIVLLLVFFFLLTSKLSPDTPTPDLPMAKHGSNVPINESVIVLMRRGTGDIATVQRADGSPFSPEIEQQNAEISEYVAEGLTSGKRHVIIRAAGSVRHGEVSRVSKAISGSLEEGATINIGVIEQL